MTPDKHEDRAAAANRPAPASAVMQERRAGVLLHPTSLPGPFGIGDLGPDAHGFVDFLVAAGQSVWQLLPLGPAGCGHSPYSARSAFAGNPLLISPELLVAEGLLAAAEVEHPPVFPADRVDFAAVAVWKDGLFRAAFRTFLSQGRRAEFDRFVLANAAWLPDFALFMALRSEHAGAWQDWPAPLARREAAALAAERTRLADEIAYHAFLQYQFARQWERLRAHAHASGVRLFGDIPIFVADDSADVWAHQRLFRLDAGGRPLVAAGVPPDYFSPTGQLWGNPVYRWDALAAEGYSWWIERFRRAFELVDLARVDHFRGFESSWQVPAGETTAERGDWVPGPGLDFLARVARALGPLPIVAEDLGVITPAVHALRKAAGFPGMKVLQFAFSGDPHDPFLPHNHEPDAVVYTGTHDNDTTRGWFASIGVEERERLWRYLGHRTGDVEVVADLVRLAYGSVARLAVVPMQDVLGLGSEARMNVPAVADGNWAWRLRWENVAIERAAWFKDLATIYGRCPAA